MKTEKIARYDRKKNKVIVVVTEEGEMKYGGKDVGYTKNRHEQEFEPSYIKNIYKQLQSQKVQIEKGLKDNKFKDDTTVIKSDVDDLEKLKVQIQELQKYDELKKNKAQSEMLCVDLKNIMKDIRILGPIVKKLKKK